MCINETDSSLRYTKAPWFNSRGFLRFIRPFTPVAQLAEASGLSPVQVWIRVPPGVRHIRLDEQKIRPLEWGHRLLGLSIS